jgi:hypothetical protein
LEKAFIWMKKNKLLYSLSVEDIQLVAQAEMGRNLSHEEIRNLIPLIEKKINWYEVIENSLNEIYPAQSTTGFRG